MTTQFDFTSVLDRTGQFSAAVDAKVLKDRFGIEKAPENFDIIPMWVADMSFAVPACITDAMQKRLTHPLFGYFVDPDAYFEKIIAWQGTQNGVTGLEPKHIGYENSVLGGLVSALNILCSKGEKILLHSPTYVGFTNTLTNNGFHMVHSPLVQDEQGVWRMDYADMEEKLASQNIHVSIFCSPHNPCGRVWERWELEKAMELYAKYDVQVISDEIWSDIIMPGHKHIPVQSISEDAKQRTIALYAPTKTFNLAGLVGSYHIIYNPLLRHRVEKEASLSHYNCANILSTHALLGAYEPQGYAWLEELRQVIDHNFDVALDYIAQFDGITTTKPEGTYMLFLDCKDWCACHDKNLADLLTLGYDVGVIWQSGEEFHHPNSIRMNLALPEARLVEAMERLKNHVFCP